MAKRKVQKKRASKTAPKRGKTAKKATRKKTSRAKAAGKKAKKATRKKTSRTKAAGKKATRKTPKRKVAKATRKKAARKTKTRATSKGASRKPKSARKSSKSAARASKPARKRFRSAVLVDQSNQIYLEAQMLRSVVGALTRNGSSAPISLEDRAHRNALNESFCLHFRTLLDFLWEGRAGKKEAVARDFFATPRRWKPAKPQDYRDLKKRLAKEIIALTTARYSAMEIDEWPYRRIFDELFVDIDRFQSTAPPENLHGCWREQPIAALSAADARSSTVPGTGSGDAVPRSTVASQAPGSERGVPEPTATRPPQTETTWEAPVPAGSALSGAEPLRRPDWSSTADDEEEHEEAEAEASREPVFASGFNPLGNDED